MAHIELPAWRVHARPGQHDRPLGDWHHHQGKVGWLGFLAIYNGIGVVQSGVEQTLMLGADTGASLGASSIVYGLIAMAMVWAPRNELNCILMFGRITTMDVSVFAYAMFSIGVEVFLGGLRLCLWRRRTASSSP